MNSETDLWLCFFRGLNVFGRGRISMSELKQQCIDSFDRSDLGIRFVDSYSATGNIAILAVNVSTQSLGRIVREAIPTAHALVTPSMVGEVDQIFHQWLEPADVPGFRWTRGISLLCEGESRTTTLKKEPDLGKFLLVRQGIVAVYRKERETARGTLDSNDRAGGWAAVSQYIEDQLGGTWTARSFAIPQKLWDKALWKLRAGLADTRRTT